MAYKRRQSDPVLMGLPSPSLSKINRMNSVQLNEHIEALEVEVVRLVKKIETLSNLDPRDDERIASLQTQRLRLIALQNAAKDRLLTKPSLSRPTPRPYGGGSSGSSGTGGSGGGYRSFRR